MMDGLKMPQRPLDEYQQKAAVGRERFIAQHPHLFIVRVGPPASAADDWSDPVSFSTRLADMPEDDDDDDELATHEIGWIIAPVLKRPGGPFPERIGVGRARNCDVVLRFSTISKLHAQFLVGPPLQLVDLGSANGTKAAGKALQPRAPVNIAVGGLLEFGGIEVKLVDAAGLYALLKG